MRLGRLTIWAAIFAAVVGGAAIIVKSERNIASEGFPNDLTEWLKTGTNDFNVREKYEDIEWVCTIGGYQTLNEGLADLGLPDQDPTYHATLRESDFALVLEFGEQRIEYIIVEQSKFRLHAGFYRCVQVGNETALTITEDQQSQRRILEANMAGLNPQ